jgi:ATP-dependent Lon protease
MTGEIDTQGRITGVGALDVKLETAYDAGCKTLIIPTENLKGDGGVERLPEAFREELQILTYPQWKAPHEPFDHRRHMLQVVAVDHIVQAADVALLDEGDLEAMDSAFVAHARELSEGKNGDPPVGGANLVMIVVKEPEEIDARLVSAAGRSAGVPVVLLVLPLARAKVPGQWSGSGSALTIRPFDPTRETLVSAVRREVGARRGAGRPLTVSLVAPFFFLKRDGIRADALAGEPDLAELRLLANNFTVQGVKIKGCKGVLNRVFCRLAELGPGQLEAVPFLRPQEGIRVVDLGFIPDKYGLDVRRAERILARCLSHWLTWAEGFGGKVHGV